MALTVQIADSASAVPSGTSQNPAPAPRPAPRPAAHPAPAVLNTVKVDSIGGDSAAIDTVLHDTISYIMIEAPDRPALQAHTPRQGDSGMSWILTALTLLFIIAAIRFRNNSKYISAMFRDAVEVRERGNVFDETVREKSFVIMLNLLWCMSVGVLLYTLAGWCSARGLLPGGEVAGSFRGVPAGGYTPAIAPLGMGICIGVTILWQIVMVAVYWVVAYVFSDTFHARMWVNGYMATTGLSTLIFFPLSLLSIFYPSDAGIILIVALGGFIIAKLIFIWKGFRIFFKEITSWLLFLYYLCSLEIVPLILLFFSTYLLCGTLL